ncbi:response regulator [Paenibacillus filicis]|uniref:Response regulator n=1 Tax=Paenibacillus gyeongsangnamensis TaxID=3388067 RepID=A0ABT4QGQ7_9BACL|nr:response regulator [Paenibacillus filicis]MCZ8516032.1 response regulator [Paenibacillus filicis]
MEFKLLICDDERMIREGIRKAVRWDQLNFTEVGVASDGEEGWSWICRYQPEIVITDIRMPKMDGLQLLSRTISAFPDTKVILLSGYSDFVYAQHAIRYRAYDYILKPTNPETLEEVCRSAQAEWQKRGQDPALIENEGSGNDLFTQIIKYIQNNFSQSIDLEKAARDIHISSVHLNRIMKKELNTTFLDYLTNVRMKEAKRLLHQTKQTVSEVCYRVGYQDPKYFSQLFRKIVGTKPSEYSQSTK